MNKTISFILHVELEMFYAHTIITTQLFWFKLTVDTMAGRWLIPLWYGSNMFKITVKYFMYNYSLVYAFVLYF